MGAVPDCRAPTLSSASSVLPDSSSSSSPSSITLMGA
eukprot:CAMPEP_0117073046 /NCGR_PEP_ID=MMETSP0472-20121206/51436_2 /TAXON_ID=693140 ORGANISM="Tiarina fusus, Strain LIS" /NCGR_SAMPLE_ID=MMETSP0472 /ASSEMBLY_ACC=CAM_ASM_000603 /LENGTH=36 /DNA_ID= /DNA_START= /DNA_END= /DNA_ORIENTATION=